MIPKDITGQQLIKKLKAFGYEPIRQNGSHIRVQTTQNWKHSETIPNHKPMREGTVKAILKNVSKHFSMSMEVLEEQLFGK
jgi:predicted RNA binding protein YcfA (HicA-like mRNA interferase family)